MGKEQDIVTQFIGNTYGLTKQLDDQIIGSSTSLQRKSDDIKKALTEVFTGGGSQQPQQPQPPQLGPTIHIQPNQNVQPQEDAGQMWLTFKDRDEIYDMVDAMNDKLNNILKKLEKLDLQSNISTKRK